MSQEINLTRLEKGQTGIISTIAGGRGFRLKLESMGIHLGSKVTKVSNLFTRGPVVLNVGGMEVAIGFQMASKIMVNTLPTEKSL